MYLEVGWDSVCLSTLAWEPGIAVEAGWSAVGVVAAVEEELS